MLHKQINFTSDGRVNKQTYIHEKYPIPEYIPNGFQIPKRPAIILMPSGAYCYSSYHLKKECFDRWSM